MRKQLALGIAGIMMVSALTACDNTSQYLMADVTYADYVTLCDYKGVEATKVTYDVTDEEIQENIEDNMYEYATYDIVDDRGAAIGDYANIDYVTTIDEKENEDYSGAEEDIVLGEGYIYPEVESALVNMKAGESKTVEVELTEEYADEAQIGKKASVTVTLNEISEENLPEYNEEFIKENTDYKSIEEYEKSVKQELLDTKQEEYQYNAIEDIMGFLLDNSDFNGYPKDLYSKCEENYDSANEYNASMYGMEVEEFMEMFGIDEEGRIQEIENSVNRELIIGAIAQKEKLGCKKQEVEDYAANIYEDYGYESADELLEDFSAQEVGYEVIYDKVMDFLYENASLTEITEDEYLKEEEAMNGDWMELEDEDTESEDVEEDEAEGTKSEEAETEEKKSEEAEASEKTVPEKEDTETTQKE